MGVGPRRVTDRVIGLPPIERPDARVLTLGSAPSVLSLRAGQYYANPRNAFWRIMAELLGRPGNQSYAARTAMLLEARIALWDVLAETERPGSMDASIVVETAVANDFATFFAEHPRIHAVHFNGRTAWALWDRHVVGRQKLPADLAFATLPSTSPANTRLTPEEKTEAWRASMDGCDWRYVDDSGCAR